MLCADRGRFDFYQMGLFDETDNAWVAVANALAGFAGGYDTEDEIENDEYAKHQKANVDAHKDNGDECVEME